MGTTGVADDRSPLRSSPEREARDAPQWVERVGRAGLVAYGLVHLGITVLAARIAFLGERSHADPRGAIALVASGTGLLGRVLLGAAALALVAFAVWQIRAAAVGFRWAADTERWRKRVGASAKAISVLSIAVLAAEFAGRVHGRRNAWDALIQDVFAATGGRWLVGAAGLVAIGVGVAMTYTGVRATFMSDLVAAKLTGPRRPLTLITGSVGNLTRAVVAVAIGVLMVLAAVDDDPDRIGGVDLALRTIASQTLGATMFLLAALGFAAFFVYCVMDAYARHP